MRTIASTFDNRDEAEAASRRLQEIGVPREQIVLKYVDDPNGGSVFLSVKASPEQVGPATEILKRQRESAAPPAPSAVSATSPTAPVTAPKSDFKPSSVRENVRPAAPAPARQSSSFGQTLLYLGALVAIFFVGWLIGSSI
jgi:hypothetical protein